MSRLSIGKAEVQMNGLEGALVKARLIAGILRSSTPKTEKLLRSIEELLCKALEDFNELEVCEKEGKHELSGME